MELQKQKLGKIKFYNEAKGWGYIIPSDGSKDIFFHVSGIGTDMKPEADMQILYNERNAVRGLIAVAIVPA